MKVRQNPGNTISSWCLACAWREKRKHRRAEKGGRQKKVGEEFSRPFFEIPIGKVSMGALKWGLGYLSSIVQK